jgi:hypothetical protein
MQKGTAVMMNDPYLAEREMGLNTGEALASAEQARLARLAKGPTEEPRRWRLPLASAFQSLKDFLMQRLLSSQEGRRAQRKVSIPHKTA